MANRIEINNLTDRIRDKMGVDVAYLPDSSIEQPDIINVAESNIISQLPYYASLQDDLRIYLESVMVLECCVLLSPSMSARLPKKETGPHAGHELWINWDNKKNDFINDRDSLIGKIVEQHYPESLENGLKSFGITFPIRKW